MKKIILMFAIGCLALSSSAGTLAWKNVIIRFYDEFGEWVNNDNNWNFELWDNGANDAIDAWNGVTSGDDVFLDSSTEWIFLQPGEFYQTYVEASATYDVYVRVFNNSSRAAATKYVDGQAGAETIVLDPTSTPEYDAGGSASDGSDWVAIPEPSSIALFGIGLVVVSAHRKLRKKKQL